LNEGEHVECPRRAADSKLADQCSLSARRSVPRRTHADQTAKHFGAAVRRARQQRAETLEQVAHRIARMDAKYLGEIERGWHSPSISTAKRIADALHTPLGELLRDA